METNRIRVDQKVINKYAPDQFAVQTILKETEVTYEYLVKGEWIEGSPSAKPDGKRVIFKGGLPYDFRAIDRFRMAKSTYLAWIALNSQSTYDPVRKDAIIERLVEPQISRLVGSRLGISDTLGTKVITTLFVPWGVRPQGRLGDSEVAVLDKIKATNDILKQRNIPSVVLLMPADLYATEVNQQVTKRRATDYFSRVTDQAKDRGFQVIPWSKIKEEDGFCVPQYKDLYNRLSVEFLRQILPSSVIEEAIGAARRRSGYTFESDIRAAAFRYLRERVFEAEVIEGVYKPIKLSAVAKNKDNFVDGNLPRLYIIPNELQFPWLK